jgi:hypothetical protein
MSRISVYPNDAIRDFEASASTNIPFDFYAVNMSMKSRLFQTLTVTSEADSALLREDAVLAHSDKAGVLIDKITQQSLALSELQSGDPVSIKAAKVAKQPTKTAATKTILPVVDNTSTTPPSAQL